MNSREEGSERALTSNILQIQPILQRIREVEIIMSKRNRDKRKKN